MEGAITWTQIGIIVAGLGFAFGVVKWVLSEFAARDTKAAAIHAAANLKIDQLERSLTDFRVEAAQTFALNASLADTERSMGEAVKGVYSRLDGLTRRLDDLLTELIRERRGEK